MDHAGRSLGEMIGGLILAAGEGSRFGARSKLLEQLDGRPLLEHAITSQSAVGELAPIIVVIGAHAEELLARIDFGRATPVVCEDWHEGMSASLRCGLRALAPACRVLVTLGDVPTISPAAIRRMLAAPDGARAAYQGRPGHPVVLGSAQIRQLLSLTGEDGARSLLSSDDLIECSDLCSGRDVDTLEDLEAIRDAASAIV